MKAHIGDWLVVHSQRDGHPNRKAQIIGTGVDGAPPYTVRWVEEERTSLVFPGPDAQIMTAAEQAQLDRGESALIDRVQSTMGFRRTLH